VSFQIFDFVLEFWNKIPNIIRVDSFPYRSFFFTTCWVLKLYCQGSAFINWREVSCTARGPRFFYPRILLFITINIFYFSFFEPLKTLLNCSLKLHKTLFFKLIPVEIPTDTLDPSDFSHPKIRLQFRAFREFF